MVGRKMTLNEIRDQLNHLKIHIDQLENWIRQATDMVYVIENHIMDLEDKEIEQRFYSKKCSILRSAGSEMKQCPPRLSNTCGEHTRPAVSFYQSEYI